jgi:hypothetical protein
MLHQANNINKKNIMKSIIHIIIIALLFTSCNKDKFLDTQSPSKQTSENVYNSLFFTEAAILGAYATLTQSAAYSNKIDVNWQNCSDIEVYSDPSTYQQTTSDYGPANFFASQENQTIDWTALYKVIELSTNVVDGIRSSPLLQTKDSTEMKAHLGEALTLRSLGNFELVKFFGDVPFKHEAAKTDLSNVYIDKVDRDTIYKYIVQDLLEAQNYVPWLGGKAGNISFSTPERINKGFIKGLTARVALFAGGWSIRDRNKFPNTTCESHPDIPEMNGYFTGRCQNWQNYYAIANQACAEIIGSSLNPHRLTDSYEDYWKSMNQLTINASYESLFEVAFGLKNSGDLGNLIGMRLDANTKYGTLGMGGGYVPTNAYYFYSFNPTDSRRDVAVTSTYFSSDNKEKIDGNPFNWRFGKWRIYWMSPAYLTLLKAAVSGRVSTGINWVVMRYSDVLLMYAESQNELYGPDAVSITANMNARNALEKVRTRAFKNDPSKVTAYDPDFFNAILNERAWELGGEGIRKFDLIRWGLLSVKIDAYKEAMCKMFTGKSDVRIFDKIYQPTDFPDTIFYKYKTKADSTWAIDKSSVNFYGRVTRPAGVKDKDFFLLNGIATDAHSGTNMKDWAVKTLLMGSGLNASYDYSLLINQMDSTASINAKLALYQMGNGVCNYRHPYCIYKNNLTTSNGILKNTFGY